MLFLEPTLSEYSEFDRIGTEVFKDKLKHTKNKDKNTKDHLMDLINLSINFKDYVIGFRYSRIKTFFKYKTIDEAVLNLREIANNSKEEWNEEIEELVITYFENKYKTVKTDGIYIERPCDAVSLRKK